MSNRYVSDASRTTRRSDGVSMLDKARASLVRLGEGTAAGGEIGSRGNEEMGEVL